MLDLSFVRSQFPSLQSGYTFMDNAGGSQVPQQVVDRISEYLTSYNVQLGASYEISATAGKKLQSVTARLADYIHASRPEEVVIGPSTTMLLRILSMLLSRQWQPGDEVIVTNSDHEANVSCWMDLQRYGIQVKIWRLHPETLQFELDDLRALLTNRTRLVAMVHASNILGTINPIQEVAAVVHEANALFCVDGVAFAPHRLVDVQAFDVDFYVFSTYKVYGPHLAILYGRYDLLRELDSLNHYFIGKDQVPYKLQPGNFNFELTYGLQGILDYLKVLHRHQFRAETQGLEGGHFSSVFNLIAEHEEVLSEILLDFLRSRSDVRIIGASASQQSLRVPTISFVHNSLQSSEIVKQVDPHQIGIRFGDFYAKKLIHDLGLESKDGVVRVSMVHYNTVEEIQRLIRILEPILAS
jgi:cysteine desulfurase family protein (TIGR01976 family)